MPEWDLFIHLAEIAGVFVAFGSLIAVRSGETADVRAVEYLRAMVAGGLWVIVAALAPIALSRFGLEGRALWAPCAALALVLFIAFWVMDALSPENRSERTLHRADTVRYVAVAVPMSFTLLGSLILIVVGVWPQVHPALYFVAVTLGLLEQGLDLLTLVWAQSREAHHSGS